MHGSHLVSAFSRIQSNIALSPGEAGFYALVSTARSAWNDSSSELREKLDSIIAECNLFHLPSNARYLRSRIGAILDAEGTYVPSVEDVLNVRVPTVGINSAELCVYNEVVESEMKMVLHDPGGQQNQRKKASGLHSFQNYLKPTLTLS